MFLYFFIINIKYSNIFIVGQDAKDLFMLQIMNLIKLNPHITITFVCCF